jgi:glycosyltransferase involved in cell wall biosynthesis
VSNYAAPPQLVDDVPYPDIGEMHRFARRWRGEHRGQWFTVSKLSGFCLLMKRVVYETIGGLDERFGLGFFDDDDLAERARRAGFELAVAHDLFVHHFGSRTFVGNGIDAEKLLDENAQQFAAKWGLAGTNARRVALRPFVDHASEIPNSNGTPTGNRPGSGARSRSSTGHARVSLTVIARNEEKNLPNCLASVRGLFDEIVVIDTGSHDRTAEIARSFGAKVFDFPWIDDFAAARNEALARATGDYAFWLDADDVVDPPQREKLRALLDGLGHPAPPTVRVDLMTPPASQPKFTAARQEPRPHDATPSKMGASALGAGLTTPPSARPEVSVARTEPRPPQVSQAAYVIRCACDPAPDGTGGETIVDHIRLFPRRPDVRWTYRVHEQILPSLRRAKIPVRWTDVTVRHTGYVDKALRAKKDAELWFRKGVVHRHRGEPAEAEKAWRKILGLKRPDQFCSVDQGIYGHLTRRNLAVLAAERGDHAEVERLWHEVLAECPGDREALAKLNGTPRAKPIAPAESKRTP